MMKNLFDLSGRVAIVTGASKGLGRAMAIGLAQAGAVVTLVSRTRHLLEETATLCRAEGGRTFIYVADVCSETEMESLAGEVVKDQGRLDILVNNAGIAPMNRTMNISTEEWKLVLDTNLNSMFYACRAAGRWMIEARSGRIVNISSVLAQSASNTALHYCSAKAAVLQLTRALALEWARFNIRVNCIAPGFFNTDMTRVQRGDEKHIGFLKAKIPMSRLGDPDEMVGAAVFLASDASSYITGATLFVDGGYTVW